MDGDDAPQSLTLEENMDFWINHYTTRLRKNLVTGKHLSMRSERAVRRRQERMLRLQIHEAAWLGYRRGADDGRDREAKYYTDLMSEYLNAPAGEFATWRKDGSAGCPNCGVKFRQMSGLMGQCRDCGWPDRETLNKWKGGQ